MKINKYEIFLVLFVVSLISSVILMSETSEICDPGVGCDIVQDSKYASTFGIKNNLYGIFIFSFLVLVTLAQLRKPTKLKGRIISIGIVIGSIVALYFIYIQDFVLEAYCKDGYYARQIPITCPQNMICMNGICQN